MIGRPAAFDFTSVDWNLSSSDISKALGCGVPHVNRMRLKLAPWSKRKKKERICQVCGGVFFLRRERKACSEACHLELISRLRIRENSAKRLQSESVRAIRSEKIRSAEGRDAVSLRTAGREMGGLMIKGPSNVHGKAFFLRSPDNRIFKGRNLNHFVRTSPELFLSDDVQWRASKSGIRGVNYHCKASKGLSQLCRGKCGTWKGWTVVSMTETFHNQCEDIIEREFTPKPY